MNKFLGLGFGLVRVDICRPNSLNQKLVTAIAAMLALSTICADAAKRQVGKALRPAAHQVNVSRLPIHVAREPSYWEYRLCSPLRAPEILIPSASSHPCGRTVGAIRTATSASCCGATTPLTRGLPALPSSLSLWGTPNLGAKSPSGDFIKDCIVAKPVGGPLARFRGSSAFSRLPHTRSEASQSTASP
jgi:hypothetical protein